MGITVNMLVSFLGSEVIQSPLSGDRMVSSVTILGSSNNSNENIDPSTIYIGDEEKIVDFLAIHPTAFGVGLGDGSNYYAAPRFCGPRLILLGTEQSILEVSQQIWRYILSIETWVQNMKQILVEGGSYQQLLNCCDGIFNDLITMNDSSFRILCHNNIIPQDDETTKKFIEQGYHDESVVALFKETGALQRWRTQTGIVHVEGTHIINSESLSYVFRRRGNYFVHIVLQCVNSKVSPGLIDTFQLLVDHMEILVKKDWSNHQEFDMNYLEPLTDLLDGKRTVDKEVKRVLQQWKIDPNDTFYLVSFRFDEKQTGGKHALGYYSWRILQEIPGSLVLPYKGDVIVVHPLKNNAPSIQRLKIRSAGVATNLDGKACSSDVFNTISEISFAYKQTQEALSIESYTLKRIQKCAPQNPQVSILSFGDCFTDYIHLKGITEQGFVTHYVRESIVSRMKRSDLTNRTEYYDAVLAYLTSNRNANEAAKRLYIHRNTLMYRVEKAQKEFGFDLSSYLTCDYILTLFHLYDLIEGMRS